LLPDLEGCKPGQVRDLLDVRLSHAHERAIFEVVEDVVPRFELRFFARQHFAGGEEVDPSGLEHRIRRRREIFLTRARLRRTVSLSGQTTNT
jgi:hypothetical protein